MIEQENGDLTEKSPLLKMIDDIIQTKLYSINDEIRRIISELLELSAKYHDIVTIVNELPSIKTEIAKDAALLNSFKANGLEQKRKSFEIISQGIKLTRNNALTYQQYLQTIINGFCQKRDEYGLTLAKISDDKILSADAITLINTLLKSCDTIIDTLLTEQENLDNQIKQFEVSEIHDKKSELEKEYLELVGKIKITGSENIQTIQNRLQEKRIREAELEILKVEKNKLSQKINDKIEEFISKRIELTEKRNVAIKEIQTEGINISIRSIANIIKWKKRLQKEFGKSDTFESDFSALAEFVLCQDNNYKNYKSFLRFILMSEKGLINDELITEQSFDKRFNNLWYDRAMHGTLSSLINVVPEDKIEIKIKQNNEEIDISYGSPGQ